MPKKTFVLLISMLFIISGCSGNSPDQTPPDALSMLPRPSIYKDSEELLLNICAVKFSELDKSHMKRLTIEPLQGLNALYEPGYMKSSFTVYGVSVAYINFLTLHYKDTATTEEVIGFDWIQYILAENATKEFFGRGESAAYIEERNGITYAITEWPDSETGEFARYMVGWAQHGQTFRGYLPASFSLEEVLAFCDAQPIETWELLGDAVSVSIQGMGDVSIYDDEGNTIIVEDNLLYRVNGDGGRERIGYRWLINENASRYQYVLEPNEYIFHAENTISEPALLVKHFAAGECVNKADYTKKLKGEYRSQFSLSVTPNPAEYTLTPDYQHIMY